MITSYAASGGESTLDGIEQTPEQRRHDREERSKKFIQGEGEKIKPNVIQVEPSTTRRYIKVVKLFFGWCVNIEGYSQNELNLDLFIAMVRTIFDRKAIRRCIMEG